jgi:hypothetical protein
MVHGQQCQPEYTTLGSSQVLSALCRERVEYTNHSVHPSPVLAVCSMLWYQVEPRMTVIERGLAESGSTTLTAEGVSPRC